MAEHADAAVALYRLKLVHTAIWFVFASATVTIPILALAGRLRWAAALSALVMVEVVVLLTNGMRCPLNTMAAGYTTDRAANFDIFLPAWLAGNTAPIFGPLFVMAELILLWRWLAGRRRKRP